MWCGKSWIMYPAVHWSTSTAISDKTFIFHIKREFLENYWYGFVMGEDSFYNSLLQIDCDKVRLIAQIE